MINTKTSHHEPSQVILAGHYWYYVVDDDTGLIYWYFGRFSGRMTGDAYSVQEFFLGFPR